MTVSSSSFDSFRGFAIVSRRDYLPFFRLLRVLRLTSYISAARRMLSLGSFEGLEEQE